MNDRARQSLVALRRIMRATDLNARNLARDTGLTMAQLLVLQALADSGSLAVKDISIRLGVSQATMTSVIDRMVMKGLVKREKSDIDRRQTMISLTEAGKAKLDSAPDPVQEFYANRFNALPDWEQAMILAALERVVVLMDASTFDAAPVLHVGKIEETH
jgi:DNA-binding MarR family transcriptional regulator